VAVGLPGCEGEMKNQWEKLREKQARFAALSYEEQTRENETGVLFWLAEKYGYRLIYDAKRER
jgi:hypothetical protein